MAKTYLFWDPLEDNVVREYDDAGVVTAEYTTEPDLYGNVISQRRQGQYRQFHYDGQGSTLAATDENENVTDTFAYTAFGEVTERTGTSLIPFQYIGQKGYYRDGLTGQIMARRRPYEPVRARWLTEDPVPTPGRSTYAYVRNSPLTFEDPSGMVIPQPRGPRTPTSPGVEVSTGACENTFSDYVAYYESREGRGDWLPLFLVNVRVSGFRFDKNCTTRTHRLSVTVFQTIRAGSIAPGNPPVDEIHELALDEFDAVEVESSCTLVERTSKLVAPAPGGAGGGWYTDINFDCFSPCECDKCVTVDHRAVMSISSKLMPPIDIRWTFTPTDLFEECGYHECEVNLNVRQR